MMSSSAPRSASLRRARRSTSISTAVSRTAWVLFGATRSIVQVFCRRTGGAVRRVSRTLVSGSSVGFSIATSSRTATSF